MTLRDAIDQYTAWRQAHGMKFRGSAEVLYLFLKSNDGEIDCDAVTSAQVCTFLTGNRPLSGYRAKKYTALAGFYRYAISRGYASTWPLPDNEPKVPPSAPPYIYSRDELCRLFNAIDANRRNATQLDVHTFRTLHLLLYGTGLRSGEARHLTLADVDLTGAVLTVRDSKFYKSRMVPVGPQLAHVLTTYAARRVRRPLPQGKDSFFLANRDGTPLAGSTVRDAFAGLRRTAGIHGTNGTHPIPMPAFVPACLRCPQAERLVSPGRRCAAAPADALHLSRSRGPGRYPSLPVNDAGVVATGLTALRALCKGTER